MRAYFDIGPGRDSFGEFQAIAVESSRRLENSIFEIVKKSMAEDNLSRVKELIYAWAADNPIENHYFVRRATTELYADPLVSGKQNIRSVFGSISQSVEDISTQLNVYYESLPKMLRWQAEYFMLQVLQGEQMYSVIEHGRKKIDSLLVRTLEDVNRQREETLISLEQQRLALTADLQSERSIILEEIEKERIETLDQVRELTDGAIDRTSVHMTDLVDRLFIKAIQLLIIVLVIGMILIYFFKRTKA
jgi:hypothetical protein